MTQKLYLLSDVAGQLNVQPHRIAYLFITRRLPEPRLRLGNRRIFTQGDINRIASALGIPRKADEKEENG